MLCNWEEKFGECTFLRQSRSGSSNAKRLTEKALRVGDAGHGDASGAVLKNGRLAVNPPAVAHLKVPPGLSEPRVGSLVGPQRTILRYNSRLPDTGLCGRLRAISNKRFGFAIVSRSSCCGGRVSYRESTASIGLTLKMPVSPQVAQMAQEYWNPPARVWRTAPIWLCTMALING